MRLSKEATGVGIERARGRVIRGQADDRNMYTIDCKDFTQ